MNHIKVYLQYPWKFPDSPYYKSLIENPPRGVEYMNIGSQKGVITNKKYFGFSNLLKRNIRNFFNIIHTSIPNSHSSPVGDYDLIHCAHCLSKNTEKPWIADFESVWQMYVGSKTKRAKERVKKILLRENCKKIIAWTKETEKEIIKEFPEIKHKVEVIYPAIPFKKMIRKEKKRINLIFSGRYFYWKGGFHALEAIDNLTKKYKNVYGIINSIVPKEVKDKYIQNKKIRFYELIPQRELFKLYSEADIMIYPGYSDTFGFGFLEAMSFGIPIITLEGNSRKELIEDGKTGFIIEKNFRINERNVKRMNEEIVQQIIKKTGDMIEDEKLMNKISDNCINEIKNGKFSIQERNKKLKNIYES